MPIKKILMCKCLQGKYPIEIGSDSDPEKSYIVIVDPYANRSELHRCSCLSMQYRGRCKHQKIAHKLICKWNELEDKGELTKELKDAMICPRCSSPLVYGYWEVNEENNQSKNNQGNNME